MCRAAFAHEAYHGICSTCAYRRPALSMQAITHAMRDTPMLVWSTGRAVSTAIPRVAFCRTFTMRVYACVACALPSTSATRLPLACPSIFLSVPACCIFQVCFVGVNGKMLSCVLSRSCVSDVDLCVGRLRCVSRVHSCLPVLEGVECLSPLTLARSILSLLFFCGSLDVQSRE